MRIGEFAAQYLEPRDPRADRGQPRVEGVAGAVGEIAVPVTGDARQPDVSPRPKRRIEGVRWVDHDLDLSQRRDPMQRQLPREQPLERADRGRGRHHRHECAEHRDPGRLGVVGAGVGADHGLVDPARARLPDAAERVDDEVVGDVEEAADEPVVIEDREQQRRHVGARIAVRVIRVVDERELYVSIVGRAGRAGAALGPDRPGDDRRLAGTGVERGLSEARRGRRIPRNTANVGAATTVSTVGAATTVRTAKTVRTLGAVCSAPRPRDEVQRQVVDRRRAAHLDHVGRTDPDRFAERVHGCPGIGVCVVAGHRGERPPAPRPAARSRPQFDPDRVPGRRPLHARERKPRRRLDHSGRTVEPPHPAAEHAAGGSRPAAQDGSAGGRVRHRPEQHPGTGHRRASEHRAPRESRRVAGHRRLRFAPGEGDRSNCRPAIMATASGTSSRGIRG